MKTVRFSNLYGELAMSAKSSKKARATYVPQSFEFAHKAVSHACATTEDGCIVDMSLGDFRYQLSARQADAIAQGLLMAVMRTSLEIQKMPWEGGRLLKVSLGDRERAPLQFSDDTIHGEGASFRFFGVCWTYEGEGEDPDYPANALCIRTMHDGGVLLGKGNVDHLLKAEQAYQLFENLTRCAHSLETRCWRIWDKVIEWRAGSGLEVIGQTHDEEALRKYLNCVGRSSKRRRNAKKH